MATIIDPKTEYAPCPFCGEPGRVISRTHDGDTYIYQVGCVNDECHVKPRTERVTVTPKDGDIYRKAIIEHSIRRWEKRYENNTIT